MYIYIYICTNIPYFMMCACMLHACTCSTFIEMHLCIHSDSEVHELLCHTYVHTYTCLYVIYADAYTCAYMYMHAYTYVHTQECTLQIQRGVSGNTSSTPIYSIVNLHEPSWACIDLLFIQTKTQTGTFSIYVHFSTLKPSTALPKLCEMYRFSSVKNVVSEHILLNKKKLAEDCVAKQQTYKRYKGHAWEAVQCWRMGWQTITRAIVRVWSTHA